jgi:UDPglucose 6-dehydrogenase
MKIGICGLGFVGNAIYSYMKNNAFIHETIVYDKYKQINNLESLLEADIIYICIPTPYEDEKKTYNMDEMDNVLFLLAKMNYLGIILIKSTILPDYCETINNLYNNLKIIHNPEFLSAATATKDFANQTHIILGYTVQSGAIVNSVKDFYKVLFPASIISLTTASTAGIAKLACNSFYATKIQFFTELFILCEKLGVNFNDMKNLMLNNNWINPMHTSIPGHDGQVSFGGACLPKDINALNQYLYANGVPNGVMDAVIMERNIMRED